MNHLMRKSAPLASMAWKQCLPALISLEALRIAPSISSSVPHDVASEIRPEKSGVFGLGSNRGFHFSTRPLEFRSSLASQAQFAMDDFSDEEKTPAVKKTGGDTEQGLEISKLNIDNQIVSALANKHITKLFPIQKEVLEPAMQGRDMIGRARTGTGKTLAFGIPIMDKIIKFNAKHGVGRNPLALVMAPTRELARQVEKEFYESAPKLQTLCVYGGTPIGRQMNQLNYGVDIVVGTPGRIIDLIKRGALNLSEVQFVVLDEADQMLAVGFEEDVEIILEKLPKNRQSMMFSATMPTWIKKLTQKYLNNPLTVDLVGDSDQKLADGITLYSIASDMYGKASIIAPLIAEHAKGGKCIVFTQTKRDADRLAYSLQRTLRCEALHGDIAQNQRERTLAGFRDGSFNVLVATDVAARGLDVPNVDLIIHFELPNSSEIFVHRSGRTGRAGKKGSAILIYSDQQLRQVQGIERDVGCKFIELPRIASTGGNQDTFGDIGGGGRFGGSFGGRSGRTDSSYGRSGGFGGSGFGRSGSYGGSSSGRTGGYGESGSSSGRTGGYGESGSGRFGSYGGSASGRGGFGGSTPSRSSEFGGSGFSRSGGFNDLGGSGRSSGSARPSGGFGDFGSNRYGGSGSSPFGDYGDK